MTCCGGSSVSLVGQSTVWAPQHLVLVLQVHLPITWRTFVSGVGQSCGFLANLERRGLNFTQALVPAVTALAVMLSAVGCPCMHATRKVLHVIKLQIPAVHREQ